MKIKRVAVVIGLILLTVAGLIGCGRKRELVEPADLAAKSTERELIAIPMPISEREHAVSSEEQSADSESEETTRLTALAEDMQEAERIADLYDIELDSFSYGVATYVTDKDVQELMNLGEENDYPTLAPNYKNKLHTAQ
ncbi:MAG: hypothetical protein K2P41_13855 [Lachnospiraceae bacterium]|nr:hypothetical protein [Lachnospiraceae bacterium]